MSPKEQKNIFVDKRGTKLKPQKQQIIDILIVIITAYFLHRKVRNEINGNHLAFLDFQGRLFLLQNGGNVKIRLKNGRIM